MMKVQIMWNRFAYGKEFGFYSRFLAKEWHDGT